MYLWNLHWVDWALVVVFFAWMFFCVFYFKKYMQSVSDFMVASRLAGPYMLAIAPGMISGINFVQHLQTSYNNGYSSGWWSELGLPVSLMLTLLGFVSYRLRQTRAMTLAQFLEMRYSRRFRVFSGIMCWVSGVLNMGIFPMIATRCFIALFGMPDNFVIGGVSVPSYPLILFIMIAMEVLISCSGGQVGLLFTGFFTNIIGFVLFLVFMYFAFYKFGWGEIVEGLKCVADPEHKSMVNPFKAFSADGINIWYYLITIVYGAYSRGCWQGGGGFGAAAKTPHDLLMSGVICRWRAYAMTGMLFLLGLGIYAMFHLPQYADVVAPVVDKLSLIGDKATQDQMRGPLALALILPTGMFGLLLIMLISGTLIGDASYMHSWGTILIQDIIMPLRGKPFEAKRHLLYLRLGIIGVALFCFFFSWFFPLQDFITLYFMITGAIYMGGAGAVVLGGLYWKRGSTPAAWTAMILGTIFCLGGLICQSFWKYIGPGLHNLFPNWEYLAAHLDKFPIPSAILTLITMVAAMGSYILVSLLGPKHVQDMDKMLHRGIYSDDKNAVEKPKFTWSRLFGVTAEHKKFERFLMYASFSLTMAEWFKFLIITIIALTTAWLTDNFWYKLPCFDRLPLYIGLGTIVTIWITAGGIRDAINLVKDLRSKKIDEKDDGFVADK